MSVDQAGVGLPPIIDAAALAGLDDPVIADVRWYLDGRDGHAAYLDAHLPGAVFCDLDRWLAAPATVADGRHPMPTPEVFAEGMAVLGVRPGRPVVAYDDLAGTVAGRLVWMLRRVGHPAALLDGGLTAWAGPTESGETINEPGAFEPRPWPTDRFVGPDEVDAALAEGRTVIDSRSGDRYRGETEPVDARAGHIPGAINLLFRDNADADGRFHPADVLAARFADVGPAPVVYCGSGVSACNNLLVMESLGITDARLYVGSWSQWSGDPDRPVATGDESSVRSLRRDDR